MAAAGGNAQRQNLPLRIRLGAMRNSSPAVATGVVGAAVVIVHRIARRAVQPAAAAGLLEQDSRHRALRLIIGEFGTIEKIVVTWREHKSVCLADAVPNRWPAEICQHGFPHANS